VCLAAVYVQNGGRQEEVMRDVAWVEPDGCSLRLVTLMGESKWLEARIVRIDLLNSSIILQRTAAEPPEGASADPTDRSQRGPV
jgi:predicted RNA-binding protein